MRGLLTRPSAWWLIIVNLIPLVGVTYLGWSVGELMLIYWIETTIIGLQGIAKMLVANYDITKSVWKSLFVLPAIVFFLAHFGGFSAGHLFALNQMFDLARPSGSMLIAVFALATSHAFSFFSNFIGRGEYRRADPDAFLWAVYGRVILLHVVIIAAAWATESFGSPMAALVILVILKTLVDLSAHAAAHRKADRLKIAGQIERNEVLSQVLRNAATMREN